MNVKQFYANLDYAETMWESVRDRAPTLTLDAVFIAVCASRAPRTSPPGEPDDAPLPDWFSEALQRHKGRRMSVGEFLFACGRVPVSRTDRMHCGQLFRKSGRHPLRSGGKTYFTV